MRYKNKNFFLAFLCLLAGTAVLPLDAMLPSIPEMTEHFHCAYEDLSQSLGLCLIIYPIAQVIYGPLSDVCGRMRMFVCGLVLSLVATFLCMATESYASFLSARFLQVMGVAALSLSNAMIRDNMDGNEATNARIYGTTVGGVFISFTPLIGAACQEWFGWRGSFWVFADSVGCILIFSWFLFKTNAKPSSRSSIAQAFSVYKDIFTSRTFLRASFIWGLGFACYFTFIAISTTLLIKNEGYSSKEFAVFIALYGCVYLLGGMLAKRLIHTVSLIKVTIAGSLLLLIAGLSMLALEFVPGLPFLVKVGVPLCTSLLGTALIVPITSTIAIDMFPASVAGAASAALGSPQFGVGGLVSACAACVSSETSE